MGKPLIIRNRGEIVSTADAEAILKVVRPAFAAFSQLSDLRNPTPQISWLNFGAYESIAMHILPGLLHRLRDKMPKLKLSMHIHRTAQLLTMLRKGELCSALITEIDDLDRFYFKTVGEDRLGFYVSKNFEIAQMGWSAVKKFGLGSLAPGKDGLPRYFSKFLRQQEEKPSILSDSFETLRHAAASGELVCVLPQRVAQRQNDLLEIYPRNRTQREALGVHKIFLVSSANCDKEEADFLATEIEFLLKKAIITIQ